MQIGDPITEKKMLDALLVARDERLYTAITDCGAGGFSSAVSEMGEETGVTVQLEHVPVKYDGLQPWEIWLSEAQERMVIAVPPEKEARLREVCARYDVEMAVIGTFTADRRLHLRYGDAVVADLDMAFLHKGIPRRHLQGIWTPAAHPEPDGPLARSGAELARDLLRILADPNVRSKEDVVRATTTGQGARSSGLSSGVRTTAPDAAVLRPPRCARVAWPGLSCALNPRTARSILRHGGVGHR